MPEHAFVDPVPYFGVPLSDGMTVHHPTGKECDWCGRMLYDGERVVPWRGNTFCGDCKHVGRGQ